jgi:hypothetical protein
MKQTMTYKRLNPTTVNGDIIQVSIVFSSFDTEEIDKLEKSLKDYIGSGLISEVSMKGSVE